MKNSIKKLLIAALFLFVGSMGYALSADSVTTNGVVVFTTGSSTESSTSDSTTESTTSDSLTKDSTQAKVYPKTGEKVGISLFLRSLGLVILAIVAAILVRKLPTKK